MYQTTNPGLAPWAMQVYRPYRAPLRLLYHFIILIWLPHKRIGINDDKKIILGNLPTT